MKQLLAGVVLIVVLGIGGLLYRNALERPIVGYQTCTAEARVCPDGSSVGRTGPSCAFAPCPPPNIEKEGVGIAFVGPADFREGMSYAVSNLVIGYEREGQASIADAIMIRRYLIEAGETAEEVMMLNTMFSPRGESATSLSEFTMETIAGHTFYKATIERFEAQVHTAYYLLRAKDVLAFEAVDRNVTDWMEPNLVIDTLPTQQALRALLATLQVRSN